MRVICKKSIIFLPITRFLFKILPDIFRYGSGRITTFKKNKSYKAENISYNDNDYEPSRYRIGYHIWSKNGERCYFGHAGYDFFEFFLY